MPYTFDITGSLAPQKILSYPLIHVIFFYSNNTGLFSLSLDSRFELPINIKICYGVDNCNWPCPKKGKKSKCNPSAFHPASCSCRCQLWCGCNFCCHWSSVVTLYSIKLSNCNFAGADRENWNHKFTQCPQATPLNLATTNLSFPYFSLGINDRNHVLSFKIMLQYRFSWPPAYCLKCQRSNSSDT